MLLPSALLRLRRPSSPLEPSSEAVRTGAKSRLLARLSSATAGPSSDAAAAAADASMSVELSALRVLFRTEVQTRTTSHLNKAHSPACRALRFRPIMPDVTIFCRACRKASLLLERLPPLPDDPCPVATPNESGAAAAAVAGPSSPPGGGVAGMLMPAYISFVQARRSVLSQHPRLPIHKH